MSWPGGSWEAAVTLIALIVGLYLAIIWLAAAFWTYGDIHSRANDPAVQAAATIFVLVFGFAGLFVYLILRPKLTLAEQYVRGLEEEALAAEIGTRTVCHNCQGTIQPDFIACPHCSARLREPCVGCSKPLNHDWVICPYCSVPKPVASRTTKARAPKPKATADAELAPESAGRLSSLADELTSAIRRSESQ